MITFFAYKENYLKLPQQDFNDQRNHSGIKCFLEYLALEYNFKVVKHNHSIFFSP